MTAANDGVKLPVNGLACHRLNLTKAPKMENKPQSHAECVDAIEHELIAFESRDEARRKAADLIARHVEAHTAPVSRTAEEVAAEVVIAEIRDEGKGAALIQHALNEAITDQKTIEEKLTKALILIATGDKKPVTDLVKIAMDALNWHVVDNLVDSGDNPLADTAQAA